jgi:hypothetical protein
MQIKGAHNKVVLTAVAGLVLLAWCFGRVLCQQAAAQQKTELVENSKFMGAEMCRRCHTVPREADPQDLVGLTEYTTWRTEDKHSLAYAVLEGPRGQKMGELLANDKQFVLKAVAGCLGCHSMHFPGRTGTEFDPKEGVSCDGCHGPSENWIGPHSGGTNWRKKSPQEKAALGMIDLRDPATKAKLCTSCHVGSVQEGKVVTHAMYAAGHPPLPGIELATFSKHLPQHWLDLKDVRFLKEAPAAIQKLYHFEIADFQNSLGALVGSGAALREQLQLVSNRSTPGPGDAKKRWPELALPAFAGESKLEEIWPQLAMAHSDCYACHHDLKNASWRQERGYGLHLRDGQWVEGIPGRPRLRPWPIDLFEAALGQVARNNADAQMLFRGLKGGMEKVYSSLNRRPFGDPQEVHQAADQLQAWCATITQERFEPARLHKATQLRLLQTLCRQPHSSYADFDSARQIASALQGVYLEWSSKPENKHANDGSIREVLEKLDRELHLWSATGADPSRDARKKLIWQQVEKAAGRRLATQKEFQETLRDMGRDKLKAALLDPNLLAGLQQIRNAELAENSQAAANYDPVVFNKRLSELSKLLPQK